jgi:MoCo/4Fe-4S cofactor protein with predicted Tat translocation signal
MTSVPTSPVSTETDGTTYWRSLTALQASTDRASTDQAATQQGSGGVANSPESQEFADAVAREFPEGITDAPDEVSRRGFLSAVAASVALAGLTSCRKPEQHILPFNKRPEGFKPGLAQYYATTLTRNGYGIGVLVKSSDGRPTKIEGNPDHPSSLGGSDLRLQAELLQLYDPARSRAARNPHSASHSAPAAHGEGAHGEHAGADHVVDVWGEFYAWLTEAAKNQGSGMHILMQPTSSPAMQAAIARMKAGSLPKARFHTWSALHNDHEIAGAQLAFGRPVATHQDFAQAEVVVSLDSDFLANDGNNLRNARAWAATRKTPIKGKKLSRLYVVESTFSSTGTAADHRFRTKSSEIPAVAFALAKALGVGASSDLGKALETHAPGAFEKGGKKWLEVIAKDLQSARGRCLVVAGPRQPAAVHAIVHAINQALDNLGKTVTFTAIPEPLQTNGTASIKELATAIDQGSCETLVCLGTNPVYDAPADLKFGELLKTKKPKTTIHVGFHEDETAQHCDWHFPLAHELECWGDARAHDGTVSIQQPLVLPLHGGVSPLEFLGFLGQDTNFEGIVTARDSLFGYELVRTHWQTASGASDFDTNWWPRALHDGLVPGSQFANENVQVDGVAIATAVRAWQKPTGFEVVLRACPKMADGRFANNSWMQEIPDPLSKLSWDNAALISMATARTLGVENGDQLAITVSGAQLQIPAWIVPGHADESVTIHLGWGRSIEHGKVANGTGFNAYPLRTSTTPWIAAGAQVTKGSGKHRLVCTQDHGTMVGRALIRETTVAKNEADPQWAPKQSPLDRAARLHDETEKDLNKSLWIERFDPRRNDPEVKKSPYQWGMVIDLNACTGCSACMVACVAENNIPMVGKIQVSRNREMFWIRTDRYFSSVDDQKKAAGMEKNPDAYNDKLEMAEDPQVANMPVPCMQCENAPCESVCPVAATMHSPDGLNDMVYNRCIGTRYCSNNCPYKVRRYNYLDYVSTTADTKRMAFNPDVTVRSRGVMEKCTYCVQRINGGRIEAKLAGKKVGDGKDDVHVTTACAQACPTQAIAFGNILESTSRVAQQRALDLNYGLLSELNTKPRTTYLGRVRNPNPELA